MAYLTDGKIGVNLSTVTAGTTTDGVNALYPLGTVARGTDGGEWMYVQAGAEISTTTNEPFVLAITEDFQAVKITKALASAGHIIGVAPQQILADNALFWAQTRGTNFNVKVAVSCAADVNLWTTATAGVLDDTSGGSHVAVLGIKIVTAASTSASAGSTIREAIMTNPLVPLLIA